MRCLLIDAGNTRVKYTVSRGKRLGRVQFVPTRELTVDRIKMIASEANAEFTVICSVIEPVTRRLLRSLRGPMHCVSHQSNLGFSLAGYQRPETIGNDRLANACGAVALYGCPVVSVDLGTALTIEVIDANGSMQGGVIAPGLATFAQSLQSAAPALPEVRPTARARRAIGRSTGEALTAGIDIGFSGAVRELLDRTLGEFMAEKRTRKMPFVVATGGDAELMAKRLDCFQVVCKNLTFVGLRRIAELNT